MMAILRQGEKAYGVTIQRDIESKAERPVALSAIYITLERLVKKGYVSSWLGEKTEERGGRAKRYFKLEGLGERALRDSLQTFDKMANGLPQLQEDTR